MASFKMKTVLLYMPESLHRAVSYYTKDSTDKKTIVEAINELIALGLEHVKKSKRKRR